MRGKLAGQLDDETAYSVPTVYYNMKEGEMVTTYAGQDIFKVSIFGIHPYGVDQNNNTVMALINASKGFDVKDPWSHVVTHYSKREIQDYRREWREKAMRVLGITNLRNPKRYKDLTIEQKTDVHNKIVNGFTKRDYAYLAMEEKHDYELESYELGGNHKAIMPDQWFEVNTPKEGFNYDQEEATAELFNENYEGYEVNGFYFEAEVYKTQGQKVALYKYSSYDNYYNNKYTDSQCVPDFSFIDPVFFTEDNDTLLDKDMSQRVVEFCGNKYETFRTKSIYYKNRKDFPAYLTFRCINGRTTVEKPNFDGMCSPEFCYESYLEITNG